MSTNAYLGGPSDAAAEAQLTMQAAETARSLSTDAINMLLHIARVAPLSKPFPSEAIGQFNLHMLMTEGLIARASGDRFKPTPLGNEVAKYLRGIVNSLQPNDPTKEPT